MIEVLKQALDALENSQRFVEASANAKMLHGWGEQLDTAEDAITSLRQVITELESKEPVAWMYDDDYQRMLTSETFCKVWSLEVGSAERGVTTVPLYTYPPQRTEERNFCPRCGKRTADLTVIHTCTPPQGIYYTPPQRTWVGLTDEEIEDLYFDKFSMGELKAFAKAIEAKLKEKNT